MSGHKLVHDMSVYLMCRPLHLGHLIDALMLKGILWCDFYATKYWTSKQTGAHPEEHGTLGKQLHGGNASLPYVEKVEIRNKKSSRAKGVEG